MVLLSIAHINSIILPFFQKELIIQIVLYYSTSDAGQRIEINDRDCFTNSFLTLPGHANSGSVQAHPPGLDGQ